MKTSEMKRIFLASGKDLMVFDNKSGEILHSENLDLNSVVPDPSKFLYNGDISPIFGKIYNGVTRVNLEPYDEE